MIRKWSHRTGLSLLELLVSLALLGLIAGGLAGAFGLGNQVWTRTEALGQYNREIALRAQLRNWLSQALPPTRLTPFTHVFSGTGTQFEFVTLADTPFAPDAAALRIKIAFAQKTLTMYTATLDDQGAVLDEREDVLARDISNLRIEYLRQTNDEPEWLPSWTDDAKLPVLIRLTADPGASPDWPEFTVRPRLQ